MKYLHTKFIFLLIFIFSLLTFFAHTYFTKTAIYADGKFYYAITRSIVKDGDIKFENEYEKLEIGIGYTKTGYVWNMYPPGTSFFWIHGFILSDGFVNTINLIPGIELDDQGFSLIYQTAVATSSIVLGILGLFLTYILLKKYFTEKVALFSVITLFAATNLLYYISVEQINSHAISFFITSLFVYFFLIYSPIRTGRIYASPTKYYLTLGLLGGVAGLVRTQDILILMLLIIQLLHHSLKTKYKIQYTIFLITGLLIGFLPQLYFWYKIFGAIGSPYTEVGFNFLSPDVLKTLLNYENGLFTTTPTVFIMVLGIFLLWKTKPRIAFYALFYFLLQLYLIASWNSSIGGSYSNRMFVSTYPLITLGLAEIIKRLNHKISTQKIIILILLIAFVNTLNILHYLILY